MSQSTFPYEPWLAAMIAVARHYRLDYSEENVRVSLEWEQGAALDIVLDRMARQLGLVVRFEPFDPVQLDPWRMPMIVEFTDGQVGVLEKMDSEGHISVLFSGDKGMSTPLNATEISERIKLVILLKPESSVPDARVDEYIKPYKKTGFGLSLCVIGAVISILCWLRWSLTYWRWPVWCFPCRSMIG
ncbi:type I secretion system ATPase [Budvicia aquatica]|uniref:Type I secretion system ATPase n=1 Tax=Budvicia aquatica TaxID=82979 RepID=A0A484Z9Y6_9GAMM|nr:type I secretion system ATPase [Budvicia aquatica]